VEGKDITIMFMLKAKWCYKLLDVMVDANCIVSRVRDITLKIACFFRKGKGAG